jgi:NAD(P)H-hydrate epimerase
VLGTGPIGQEIGRLCRALGLRATGVRRDPDAGVPPGFDAVAGYAALPDLLPRADWLLLACPLDDYRGDAAVNAEVARRAGLTILDLSAGSAVDWEAALCGAVWIVDALLGTGATGAPRGAVATAITAINETHAADEGRAVRVFAVDLPSGLDCDTGDRPGACVRADVTATFVAPKPGFDAPTASDFTGAVHVLAIGAPAALLGRFGLTADSPARG